MLAFTNFELDPDRGSVVRDGQPVALRPKAFALLAHLARNPGRLISKDELVDAVWKRRVVSDDSVAQCIREIRTALGPRGRSALRTVPRRGYLLESAARTDADLSIAVVGSEPLAGELTLGLSRVPQSSLVCRATAGRYDTTTDPRQIARELGVRYVVLASFDGRRASIALVDGSSGRQLWADRYPRPDAAIGRITLDLHTRVIEAAADDPVMRAWALWNRQVETANRQAQALLTEALADNPASVLGWITLANTHLAIVTRGGRWSGSRARSLAQAARATDRALALDARHPNVHGTHGVVLYCQRRFEESIAASRRQIVLNPNYALGHYWLGLALIAVGRPREALPALRNAIRLSPNDPRVSGFYTALATARLALGERAAAITWARRAALEAQPHPMAHALLAAALALAGDRDQAHRQLALFREARPRHTLRRLRAEEASSETPYRAQRKSFYDGLRRAGLPEG
jgi:DNA-binding winged helix-turn-helix (wHTH) protein/Tfp pilus assembly protein PilF